MIQDLCLSHRHVQLVLKSADFLLEKLRDIAAEATGHPSEPIQA